MLELAILGLLEEQALHGYELRKRLGETLGFLASVSFGSLYPALARLEASGAVVVLGPSAGGSGAGGSAGAGGGSAEGSAPGADAPWRIPMTGSLAGERAAFRTARATTRTRGSLATGARATGARATGTRATRQRRVYAITESGAAMFKRLLAGDDSTGESEDDRCFALRLAFARHLSPDARLRLLERRRAVLIQRRARTRAVPTIVADTWRAALAEHGVESLEGDISWLDRLIEAEKARSNPPQTTPSPTTPSLGTQLLATAIDADEPTTRKVATT